MIAYAFILTISRLLAALPLGLALALGRALGTLSFHVVRIRRSVVLANLRHVFGASRSEAEIRSIASEAYRQVAMTFVEVLRSTGPRPSGLERNVEFDPLEPFAVLRAGKRPVVILQPHAGNFDLTAYAFAALGFPLHTVMKAIHNRRLSDLIVGTRERHGVRVHMKGTESFGEIIEVLRRGEWVGLLPDQNARGRGVTVDFLGRPASIFKGPALFHLATGAPICIAVDERLASDPRRHHVHVRFLPAHAATGDESADVRAIMQAVSDTMAEQILRNPSQYFWFHRLWGKDVARPPGRGRRRQRQGQDGGELQTTAIRPGFDRKALPARDARVTPKPVAPVDLPRAAASRWLKARRGQRTSREGQPQ